MFGLFILRQIQNWNQNENPSRINEVMILLNFHDFRSYFCLFIILFCAKYKWKSCFWVIFGLFILWKIQNWNQNENASRIDEVINLFDFHHFRGYFCHLSILYCAKYKWKSCFWVMFGLFILWQIQIWNQNENPSRIDEVMNLFDFYNFRGFFCLSIILFDAKY